MPISRYSGREIIVNNDESYDELFRDRGIKQVSQYETRALYSKQRRNGKYQI